MRHRRALRWSVLGRDRSSLHLQRKIYHALMGLSCFVLYAFFLSRNEALFCLVVVGGTWILFDLLRVKFAPLNYYALLLFGKVMRREELKSLSGNSFYIFGLILIVSFFPKNVGLLSVLFLAVGDPAAALVGAAFGRHKLFGKKSMEGSLACFGACFLVALLFSTFYLSRSFGDALLISFLGATIGMISEMLPVPIDDNFTVPVVSSLFLSLIFPLF